MLSEMFMTHFYQRGQRSGSVTATEDMSWSVVSYLLKDIEKSGPFKHSGLVLKISQSGRML